MPSPVATKRRPSSNRSNATKEKLMKALGPMRKIGEAPKRGMTGLAKGADDVNKAADKAGKYADKGAKAAIKTANDKVKAAKKKVAGLGKKLGL